MADKSRTSADQEVMIANLEKATGKSFQAWLEIAQSSGLEKHGEIVKFLQDQHGLTYGYANLIVHNLRGSAAALSDDRDALIQQQYAKGKEHLRPIYDRLIEILSGFGGDVEFMPMKAYVSVRRSKQIACIQPTTRTRVDVGIKLKGVEPTERLTAGGFNGMVTHLVKVEAVDQVDDELIGWLRQAYEAG